MDIEQKLALSQQPIIFFTEGSFLKVYNHSFYVVSQLLGFKLKPIIKYIKKIDQIIIYGGFPVNIIHQRYPSASVISQGYQLKRSYDLSGYALWYQQHCRAIKDNSNGTQQKTSKHIDDSLTTQPLIPIFDNEKPCNEATFSDDALNKPLTKQQLLFLSSWQMGKYPNKINDKFIQSLKYYFKFI